MKKINKTRCGFFVTGIIILMALFLVNLSIVAQTTNFEGNISVPEVTEVNDYASGILDVIAANGKFFAYTGDKIIVLDSDGETVLDILQFTVNEERFGKYNPVYHNSRLHMPGVNVMAIFENPSASDREDLYVVTPNLDIMLLNTNTLTWSVVKSIPNDPQGLVLTNYQPLHGVCRIKYDSNHERLYWLIKGRQVNESLPYCSNCTGQFHYREVYFVIYDVDNNGNLTEDYEFHDLSKCGDIPHYKNMNICDFEFNRDDNNGNCDYFFLAKYNIIETWKFGDDPLTNNVVEDAHNIHNINVPDNIYGYLSGYQGEPAYYKFGRMLYIEDFKKIVAFPYRYPGYSLEDPDDYPPLIYVIDGFSLDYSTINAPNQRIYDALYIPSTNHLVISYSAHPDDKIHLLDPPSDIATSLFNTTSQTFSAFTPLNTNSNPPIPGIDVNSSTHFTNVNGQILISKKDEVLRLINNTTSFSFNTLLSAKNNFFGRGASGNSSQVGIIINRVGGKIEKFTSNGTNASHISSLNSYYPVYHSVSNTMGTKIYFFNKLNHKKSGFFIYEPDETPPVLTHITNFSSPVGDCIYNPFRDEFLLSQNEDFGSGSPASIIRYNSSNAIAGQINLPEISNEIYLQNATKMYIDPNGILYVLANAVVDVGENSMNDYPYIVTYDAGTYDFINSYELDNFTTNEIISTSEYYMAHFCYCKWNNTTYFTVTPQEISLPPYHSEYNTMTGPFPNSGYLYSINNGTLSVEAGGTSFIHPGKIICPDDGNDDYLSPNEGQLFFISDDLKTYLLDTKETASGSKKVNDIVYSPYHDKVFAFADEGLDSECNEDRTAVLYQFTGGFPISFEQITNGTYLGQVSSFFLNLYNNKLYLQTKFDNYKLGASPAKLIEFDIEPGSSSATATEIVLWDNPYTQNRSFYPELDHCPDFRYFTCNLTTPAIDPYNNIMYLPNGGFSNVSIVSFTPMETLVLNGNEPHKGITWLSIPRHLRPPNNVMPIEDVFDPDNISGTLEWINIDYNYIEEIPYAGGQNIISSTWQPIIPPFWTIDPDNADVYSTRGYIVSHLPDEQKTLTMKGTVELPDAGIDLYCKKDNWVGYFLYEEQSAFDALADVLDDIYHIKGQTFNCYRYNYPVSTDCGLKSTKDYPSGTWICNNRPNIKYGDMIMVKPEEDTYFQWNYSGNPPSNLEIPKLEYFEYEERATYTTFVIELDTTTSNPDEIGAFVNDSCVGACPVNEQDSVVVLSAYLGDQPGDSVSFEQHFASSKSTNAVIKDYFVLNNETHQKERRIVRTGEKQDVFIISFRNEAFEEDIRIDNDFNISIYPNPVTSTLQIEYTLTKNSSVNIVVLDVMGKQVAKVLNKNQPEGVHTVPWNMNGVGGHKVGKGVYFINVTIDEQRVVKKLIIN